MEEVTLEQVLAAREARVREQERLLSVYREPVISFTMNIPGPVKDTPLIRRAFGRGRALLFAALDAAGLERLSAAEVLAPTGCELLCSVRGGADDIKRITMRLEDAGALGRLFDMDVLAPDGTKLERTSAGGSERSCIVCGAMGRGCASRRTHSVTELQAAARRILTEHFAAADCETAGELVTRALLDEVRATPKPGLVDRSNNGSHRDMTLATFEASAEALRPWWPRCFALGQETAGEPPAETFARLRAEGEAAERAMLAATGGVNTHKGAIFTLGVLCGAAGRLWRADAPVREAEALLRECAAMTRAAAEADFAALDRHPEAARTAGERFYVRCGLRGIRGEVADGLPSVAETALPMLRRAQDAGLDRNAACVCALLALIGRGGDTNLVARGGSPEAAAQAAREAAALLSDGRFPAAEEVEALDRSFIARNLSPGGCADLLAAALFLDAWRQAA